MYLRTTTRRASDGTVVRYVQLAHNRRVNGVTQAQVLVNLGREEHLDLDGLRRLVASIRRWTGDDEPAAAPAAPPAAGGQSHAAGAFGALRVVDVRPLGAVWLLDGLWKALGVDVALAAGADPRRWTSDAERVAFACTAVRAVEPDAVTSLHEWVRRCVLVPGLESVTPGEIPAVAALVAATDLDLRLGAICPGRPRPPAALEAFRSTAERVAFGTRVVAWLAASLVATVEHRTGLPWAVVRGDLGRIAAVALAGPHGSMTAVSEPTPAQRDLFEACGVGAPPRVLDVTLT
ncbi:MAG: hypothetical protein HY830_06940 [Actinobacteria bacterium]|nr:hypothetical protein [Actinomycetota bacterium]